MSPPSSRAVTLCNEHPTNPCASCRRRAYFYLLDPYAAAAARHLCAAHVALQQTPTPASPAPPTNISRRQYPNFDHSLIKNNQTELRHHCGSVHSCQLPSSRSTREGFRTLLNLSGMRRDTAQERIRRCVFTASEFFKTGHSSLLCTHCLRVV